MFSASDLPDTLPVFPLPGALLLPRGRLPLHIFEPRFLAMLDDALKSQARMIGMVQPSDGVSGEKLHDIGCAGRITAFTETGDGRYMITLTGVSRFHLGERQDGFAPYPRCAVRWNGFSRDLGAPERDPELNRVAFLDLLGRYFSVADLQTDWDNLKDAEDELLINSLSMLCPFGPEDKQALLEAPTLSKRRETLVTLMEYALRRGSGEERVQ